MLIQCPTKPLTTQQFCDLVVQVMTSSPLEENDPRIELRDRLSDQSLGIREDGEKVFYCIKTQKGTK